MPEPFRHGDTVTAVAFDRTGKWLATGSDDNTARVWDIGSGREEQRFNLNSPVRAVRFSPDGLKLSTLSLNGNVGVSSLGREDLLKEVCSRLPRNLTPQEWKQYIGDNRR